MALTNLIADRYEILSKLGAGAAAQVFRVRDLADGSEKALKLLRGSDGALSPALIRAFHHEFRLLTEIHHPHLVGVHDFGTAQAGPEDEEAPWFTMDLVPGKRVDEVLGPSPDWGLLARVADAVLDALGALHQRGLVHRDITVTNILAGLELNREPPPVWLMDLGLADQAEMLDAGVVRGTLATLAPETLRGGRVDGRADFYSLGCVLFRLATGQDPFPADNPWDVIRAHLSTKPTPPRHLNPEVPRSLESLILDLLAKEPEGRPATVGEVRRQLSDLSGRRPDRIIPLPEPLAPSLSGREREFAVFQEAAKELDRGRGAVLLVEGSAGLGRSRLLEEFRLRGRLGGRRTILLRAGDLPRLPFALIDAALRVLGPGAAGNAGEDLPARVESLCGRLAEQPTLLLVDDLTAADVPSAAALEQVARRIGEARLPCMLILSLGDAAAPLRDALLEKGLARLLRLRPLEAEAAGHLAASMLGKAVLPPSWVAPLHQATGGLPALVVDLITALVREGKAGPGAELPEQPPRNLAELARRSPRSEALLESRWEGFSEGCRALLSALAVSEGEPLSFNELESMDPHTAADPADLDAAVEAGLLRRILSDSGELSLALATPALGPSIISRSPPRQIQTLHRRRAQVLASQPGTEGLRARHLLAAGDVKEADRLLLDAAAQALQTGTPLEAIRLTGEILGRGGQEGTVTEEGRLRRIRASALATAGHPEQAEEEFLLALAAARKDADPLELAETLRSAGSFQGRTGRVDAALDNLEEALALLDELGDTAGGAAVLLSMGKLLMALGRSEEAEKRLAAGLRQARRADRGDLEASLLLAQGDLALKRGWHDKAQECFRRAEAEAARSGATQGRHAARRGRILALEASGNFLQAIEELESLVADSRQGGHLEQEAEALALMGRLQGRLGRRSEAVARLGQAASMARRLGRQAMTAELMASQAALLLERGQPRLALTRASEARELALAARSQPALAQAIGQMARIEAFLGRIEAVEECFSRVASGDSNANRARRSLALGQALLATDQADRARELLQEACFLARRARSPALEADGLLALAEAYLEMRDQERSGLALKKARVHGDAVGEEEIAARVRLLTAELELAQPGGDMALARDEAELAAETLTQKERGDWSWRAWAALAAASRRLGDVEAAESAEREGLRALEGLINALPEAVRRRWRHRPRIRALLDRAGERGMDTEGGREGAAATLDPALGRRIQALDRLLEINRALNSTLELDRLLEILLDTAIELTGAERGFVLLQDGGQAEAELARGEGGADLPGDDREFSRSVAQQVIKEDRPLVAHDAQTDERLSTSRSIHALQIHSILAHPLRVRGKVAGAIVVDSRQAAAMFDEGHQELMARLADQAGIALGNARLVARLKQQTEEIQRLNALLREQVEEQRVEILEKQSNLEVRFRYDCMIGASSPMQKVYRAIDKILPTEIPVLVTGDSGTGKDLVARVLHYNGSRSKSRFVTINCAALTDTLLESELFGHRRGAFTGADRDRKGLFEQADGGTIFLDEIGEMPLHLQPKLLRAIQFGEVRRVGEDTDRRVDVRIIAATNRDLTEMVREGSFREDLFYRLDVARIHIAPLRERLEDIGLLVGHFLESATNKSGLPPKTIEPAALRLFLRYDWPGNVRELENEITKLAAFTEGELITELDVLENASFLERAKKRKAPAAVDDGVTTLQEQEIDQIRQALRAAGGNRTKAAEMLGIDRSTLYRKLKKYGEG